MHVTVKFILTFLTVVLFVGHADQSYYRFHDLWRWHRSVSRIGVSLGIKRSSCSLTLEYWSPVQVYSCGSYSGWIETKWLYIEAQVSNLFLLLPCVFFLNYECFAVRLIPSTQTIHAFAVISIMLFLYLPQEMRINSLNLSEPCLIQKTWH